MQSQITSLLLVVLLSVSPVKALDLMAGLNVVPETSSEASNIDNDERANVIWLMQQMRAIEDQIDVALKERDALTKKAQEEIATARRRAANARAARDTLVLLFGAACAAGEAMSGSSDTSSSFAMTDHLMKENEKYSSYDAADRMQAAGSVAHGLNQRAQSMDHHANDLQRQRQKMQGQLDKQVIHYLSIVNELISSVPGFEESGLGKVRDLAFDPAAAKDKSFDGPLVYSLTFIINNQPVDVRLTDLEKLIDDDFASLIAQRKEALKAANGLNYDNYLASLKLKLERVNKELSKAYQLKDTTSFLSKKRKQVNSKIRKMKARKSDLEDEINDLEKEDWLIFKREQAREELAKRAAAEQAKAKKLLARTLRGQEMFHQFDKGALNETLEEIKSLI